MALARVSAMVRSAWRVYVSDRAHVGPVSAVLGETFKDPRPTNTTIVCGFATPEMMVELEVTALARGRATR